MAITRIGIVGKYALVIPVHNGERTIERAILSALGQTKPPAQIIVFDNASTDATYMLVHRLARRHRKIKVVRSEQKLSALESFRSSIGDVYGEFLWLAADDVLLPNALEDLYQLRCSENCTHAIGHRVVFFDRHLSLRVGKNFSTIVKDKSPVTKFLEFPADNSIFYSLVDAERARMILPQSEKYAWDWVYTAKLLMDPFHYQNAKVGLLRETSPIASYRNQALSALGILDRIFPLRKATLEILKSTDLFKWSNLRKLALLNIYVAIMFGSMSTSNNSVVPKILKKFGKFSQLISASLSKYLRDIARKCYKVIRPLLRFKVQEILRSGVRKSRYSYGFVIRRFGQNDFNEVPSLRGLELSPNSLIATQHAPKITKKIKLDSFDFENFGDLVKFSNFVSLKSVNKIEVTDNFRSENHSAIYRALIAHDLIKNVRLIKNSKNQNVRQSKPMKLQEVIDLDVSEWKKGFNKTSRNAIVKTGGKQKLSKNILVCLPEVPVPHRDSGSNDIIFYLLLLVNLGHQVTVAIPHRHSDSSSLSLLESICKVVNYSGVTPVYNQVIVYGPFAYKMFYNLRYQQDYIYIMIDAVFRRFRQDPTAMNSADLEILGYERDAIQGSRVNLSISLTDIAECYEEFPHSKFELFPIVRSFELTDFKNKETRKRILFIGSLTHTPNRIALEYILKEIAPRIEVLHPDLVFTIIGKGTSECKVHSGNVELLGMIDNLEEVYSESIVSLAPMSVAAGINGKVVESISFRVISLVSKEVALNLSDSMKKCTIVCDSVDEYVKAIGDVNAQNSRVLPKFRVAVAKEVDGCANSLVLRRYLK